GRGGGGGGAAGTSRSPGPIRPPTRGGGGFPRTGRRPHGGPDPRCCVGTPAAQSSSGCQRSSSRTASGSCDSDSRANLTTPQNSTEHTRRSATGPPPESATSPADEGEAAPDDPDAGPGSACHCAGQNRWRGEVGSPHDGQRPSGAPQSAQNRSLSPRDAPHRGHVTTRHIYLGQARPAK